MGACLSNNKGSPIEQATDDEISTKMKQELNQQEYTHKILLLGPGDSGKTTILKQMRKIYGSKSFKSDVVGNRLCNYIKGRVMSYMKILCEQSTKLNIDLKEEQNEDYRTWFINEVSVALMDSNDLTVEIAKQIKSLFNDKGIRETLSRRAEFEGNQIPDNVDYFMDRIDDIASDNYQVTFEDYLRIRMKTTGFSSETFIKTFNDKDHSFIFTDVGGQRSERKKWINMVHSDIDVVVYVVAISEYDLLCHEDGNTLRLDEALHLFKTILLNGYGDDKTVTLFFNKYDLFVEKINDLNQKTIAEVYSDFPSDKDPRDEEHVIRYIYDKFMNVYDEILTEKAKPPHYHTTTALDTSQIGSLFEDIEEDLITERIAIF